MLIPMANMVARDNANCQICQKKDHTAVPCYNRHNENWFPTVDEKRARY